MPKKADKKFIDQQFQKYHGRSARENKDNDVKSEYEEYSGKNREDVTAAIKAGRPKADDSGGNQGTNDQGVNVDMEGIVDKLPENSPLVSSKDDEGQFQQDVADLEGKLPTRDKEQAENNPGYYHEKSAKDFEDKTGVAPEDQNRLGKKAGDDKKKGEGKQGGQQGGEDQVTIDPETGDIQGDPVRDKLNQWEDKAKQELEQEAEQRKEEYRDMYETQLELVDEQAARTIERINSTYDKRIDEQKRINQRKIDRTKAYGLGGGGRFTPVMFGDAVTKREEEAASRIRDLESKRNGLITDAQQAKREARSKLLRNKMEDIDEVENQMKEDLNEVEKEANKQYELLREERKRQEKEMEEAKKEMEEQVSNIAARYASQFMNMDEEEKDQFIEKISEKTGLEYGTIYAKMQSSVSEQRSNELERRKTEAQITKDKAQAATDIAQEQRKQQESAAEITKDKAQAQKYRAQAQESLADAFDTGGGGGGSGSSDDDQMRQDIPETFTDHEDFMAKRRQFVRKYGEDGRDVWDDMFLDPETDTYNYSTRGGTKGGGGDQSGTPFQNLPSNPLTGGGPNQQAGNKNKMERAKNMDTVEFWQKMNENSKAQTPKEVAEEAGFDYEGAKKAGYSDQKILRFINQRVNK